MPGSDHEKAERALPLIHLVFSNQKAWLLGTHHGVSQQHLPAYMNEFVFRFNWGFCPMTAFISALGIGVNVTGSTYLGLYDGRSHSQWEYGNRRTTINKRLVCQPDRHGTNQVQGIFSTRRGADLLTTITK